jgi:hypothetical protein
MKKATDQQVFVDHNSDDETTEETRRRYIYHIDRHDRRYRLCPVGCQAHIVSPSTMHMYKAADKQSMMFRREIKDMNIDELKEEVDRI